MQTKFYSKDGVTESGAPVELGFVEHEGVQFSAIGSLVDHAQGIVIGHVYEEDGRFVLRNWHGDKTLATLRLTGTFKMVPPHQWFPVTMQCFATVIDGRRYFGRKSAGWSLLRLRASEGQEKGASK